MAREGCDCGDFVCERAKAHKAKPGYCGRSAVALVRRLRRSFRLCLGCLQRYEDAGAEFEMVTFVEGATPSSDVLRMAKRWCNCGDFVCERAKAHKAKPGYCGGSAAVLVRRLRRSYRLCLDCLQRYQSAGVEFDRVTFISDDRVPEFARTSSVRRRRVTRGW